MFIQNEACKNCRETKFYCHQLKIEKLCVGLQHDRLPVIKVLIIDVFTESGKI